MRLPPEEFEEEGATSETSDGLPEEGVPAAEEEASSAETEATEPLAEEAPAPAGGEKEKDEAEELRDLLVRVKADFSNYQKRVARETEVARKSAQAEVLLRLVDLLDVVERTEKEADKYTDFASLRGAVSIAAKEAEKFARESKLERIPTVGRPFDPAVHEALMVVETDCQPEGTVVEEVRPGYMFGGRVLRHAQVVVARRPEEE